MRIRGRKLKFTAVLVLVVLALTGFSTGRGRGGSHGHSSSGGHGGGCSSSSQDHDSSSSSTSGGGYGSGGSSGGSYGSDDDDDYYASSGGSTSSGGGSYTRRPNYGSTPTSSSGSGSGKALRDGTAKLVSCASAARPYATVEVSNPNGRKATFSVSVTFEDAQGITVVDRYGDVTVPAQGRATVDVEVGPGLVDSVDHCEVDGQALVDD
ncbi:predicted protein [Streptomyces viridochromogenes DSM 40736]|uniref:Predicted protein n=1 Tax=Streptomyces viridochromogenes (strain DSM 40736 / JCM 4977 / BCRC 1201 / Tue 494) TaxID=591159 RepID=D9XIF8_STRVT|nr:hypothetical protein [Streptomyces viridochromogenes]EFL32899.1 predicted protein [Streptomyces viridochromogenes DSM 40736]